MKRTKQVSVGGVPGQEAVKILGMMEDLNHKLRKGVITVGQLGLFLKKENPFAVDYSLLISEWAIFYKEVFGIEVDFFDIFIPTKRAGFDRLLIILQGMTTQRIFDKCVELFTSWKRTEKDLDEFVKSDRIAQNGDYAIWVRDRTEADEELRNLSASQLKEQKIPGITLEERLIYELKYFKETGKHLDSENVTLCSGSRDFVSDVPDVSFDPVCGVMVSWTNPDYNHPNSARSRQVVF